MNSEIESAVLEEHASAKYDWRKELVRGEGTWEDAFYHRISNPRQIDPRFLDTHPQVAARPGEYSWCAARIRPGSHVVDIGTGPSDFPHKLVEFLGCTVTCVDPDMKDLPAHEHIEFLRIPFENWNVPANIIECVTLVSVLEHVKPISNGDIHVMQNVHRCLKPGGICLLTMPFTGTMRGAVDPRYDGISSLQRYYSLEDIYLRLIEPSGFILAETDYLWTPKDATCYRWSNVPKATVICVALRKKSEGTNAVQKEQFSSSAIFKSSLEFLTS